MGDRHEQPDVALIRVRVRGSRFWHYVPDGAMLTLCGRVTEYAGRYRTLSDYCRRCTIEASRRGWTTRP
jgi:hypothetical protein